MKRTLAILALMLPMMAFAQWRVGVNCGADMNHFIIDKQYQTDYQYKDRWGVTMGIMGQYDITDWAGVRAELNWTQKNYRLLERVVDGTAVHNDLFLHRQFYKKESETTITNALNKFLK